MPATKSRAALSQMIDISDDELDQTIQSAMDATMDSSLENVAPAQLKRTKISAASKNTKSRTTKNIPATKVTKPRVTTRRASGGTAARKTVKSTKRGALAERDVPNGEETEEVDEFADEAPVKKSRGKRVAEHDAMDESMVDAKPAKREKTRATTTTTTSSKVKGGKRARDIEVELDAAEEQTGHDTMDLDPSAIEEEEATIIPPAPQRRPTSHARQRDSSRDTRTLHTQRQGPQPRSRAGSTSDPDRRLNLPSSVPPTTSSSSSGDPALRRKLGDATKKLDALTARYAQLRDLGLRDAESNFDKLRTQAERRARDQDEVIASLKREVASLRGWAAEAAAVAAGEVERVKREGEEAARVQNGRLVAEVEEVRGEVRALGLKLVAAREAVRVAEEQAANSGGGSRAAAGKGGKVGVGAVVGQDSVVAVLKLKEELYSDLTGLMVRNVKKVDGEDVFDCIQTGRNGTLHFHLSIPQPESAATAAPPPSDGSAAAAAAGAGTGGTATGYDDVEFAYTPLLDPRNDRDLFELLPDYLTEEICFPRGSAARFYAKVLDSMSRKVVIDGEE